MTNKTWYLGLDIGTASVGWAPLILNIKLLEKIKKDYGELDYLKKLRLQKNAEDIVLVEED